MAIQRQKLELPSGHNKLLLHSCCAPCSGEVMESLIESNINFSIFFYNPNIHPVKEYLIRKEENIRFAENIIFPLLMQIMTPIIGLPVLKVWKMNLNAVSAVPCVLICASSVPLYMLMKMDLV